MHCVWLSLLLVVFHLVIPCSSIVNVKVVHHFLVENYIKTVLHLSCAPIQYVHQLRKDAQALHVLTSSADISGSTSLDYELLFHYHKRMAVVADLECPMISSVFEEVSKRTYFHQRYFWLIFAQSVNQSAAMLRGGNINVDAEITVAIPVSGSSYSIKTGFGKRRTTDLKYDLWDVYKHSHLRGGLLNMTYKYQWDEYTLPRTIIGESKYRRRINFHGLTLKGVLTISDVPPNYTLEEDLDSSNFAYLDSMNRLNYRLFRMMEDIHNFKIFVIRSKYWGLTVNGTWIGAIGFIVRKDVDICMTALRWSPERSGFYDTTTYTYHSRVQFLFRHPKGSIEASNIFLQPFVTFVWICVILIGLVLAYFLRNMFKLENRRVHLRAGDDPNDATLSNSFLIIFGIFFQQGYSAVPRLTSARLLILSALIFSILLFQFYSSFIVGSLLTESPKTIRTIQQLLDSRLECGIDEVSYIRDILVHAIDPVAIKLYHTKILAKNNVFNLDKGLELIKRGGFAFHTDISSTYIKLKGSLSDAEICELQEIAYAKPFPCGPAVPLMSPYQELIKINIRRMFEAGLHAYHSSIWEQKKPKCAKSSLIVAPVDIEHFSSALYILLIGSTLSVSVLVTEIIVHRAHKRIGALRERLNYKGHAFEFVH